MRTVAQVSRVLLNLATIQLEEDTMNERRKYQKTRGFSPSSHCESGEIAILQVVLKKIEDRGSKVRYSPRGKSPSSTTRDHVTFIILFPFSINVRTKDPEQTSRTLRRQNTKNTVDLQHFSSEKTNWKDESHKGFFELGPF